VCVCVVDRTKARLFDYQNREECREVIDFFTGLPRESEGWKGYGAGHIERHVSEFAKQHYKHVADTILKFFERGSCQKLVVGLRDENRSDFESVLHPQLKRNLIGRFHGDPATATPQQIADNVERILGEYELNRRQALVREVLAEAQRKAHGAVGLRHVLQSLEKGEVQTLLLGDRFQAAGVECRYCGHLDMKAASACPVCAHPTAVLDDISAAILGLALRNSAEVVYVRDDPAFETSGSIAALLRFRAEQSKAAELAS
jgi:peptide subunit release factor 1 (eRF1)